MNLTRRFKVEQAEHPEHSTLVSFIHAVSQSRTTKKEIQEMFDELVNKRDYSKGDKDEILRYIGLLKK